MDNRASLRGSSELLMRFGLPLTLALLALLFVVVPKLRWGLIAVLPLLAVAVWDFVQTRHTLRRNYPLLARFAGRWRPAPLSSRLHRRRRSGRPAVQSRRARVGLCPRKGTTGLASVRDGTGRLFGRIRMARTFDGAERCASRMAGRRRRDASARSPIAALLNISAMSFGSLSANAIMALNKGAADGRFYHDTGEGGLSRYHRSHGGDLVWEIGSGYFGCRDDEGQFRSASRFAETAQTATRSGWWKSS